MPFICINLNRVQLLVYYGSITIFAEPVYAYNHCNDLKSKMAAHLFAYSLIQAIGVNVDWQI